MTIKNGEKAVSAGPWGGLGGHHWDDGAFSNVRQIIIAHGSGIDSIQFEYDSDSTSVWSQRHGGSGGNNVDKVKLDNPDEFLVSVNGTYGSINKWGTVCVRSLAFKSNKKTYGPFGVESGTCFSLPLSGVKIVGFHGKRGWYLDAIGVYYKPITKEDVSKAVVRTQFNVANNGEKLGYSVIQGSVGESYDIVVAVKQRDASGNLLTSPVSSAGSRQSSDLEIKDKPKTPEKKVTKKAEGLVTCGPWGGTGGTYFDDGIYTGIRQINLSRNLGIVSIRVCYDRNGQLVWGSKHGGTGGFKHDKIIFDYPTEILTHVTGTCGPLMYMGPNIIRSLTFHTNKGKHGPFGDEQGPSFSNKVEGKIVGFFGREALFLDAIGVHVMDGKITPPKPSPYNAIIPHNSRVAEIENSPWANKLVAAKQGTPTEVAVGVIKEPAPCGPGPWGGDGGKPWDDGVYSGIKQIFLTRSDPGICSVQLEYDRSGQSVWSTKHGGHSGVIMHRIKLEYPSEVVTCMSGYYGPVNSNETAQVIKSLTFYTSRGKYGPYGEEIGTYFTTFPSEGKVVGFHGRSGLYLNAIGVHMQHWLGSQKVNKSSLFKFF